MSNTGIRFAYLKVGEGSDRMSKATRFGCSRQSLRVTEKSIYNKMISISANAPCTLQNPQAAPSFLGSEPAA